MVSCVYEESASVYSDQIYSKFNKIILHGDLEKLLKLRSNLVVRCYFFIGFVTCISMRAKNVCFCELELECIKIL